MIKGIVVASILTVLYLVAAFALLWGIFTFVSWTPNPFEWQSGGRVTFVLFYLFSFAGIYPVFSFGYDKGKGQ